MAKPGRGAREFRDGAGADLSRLRMSDDEALAATEAIELSQGLRCGGCGRRITRGFAFVSIAVKEEAPVMKRSACARRDCDYADACRAGATYVEEIEYVWLDQAGRDAQPALAVVRANEQREREAQATRAARPEDRAEQSGDG